MLFAGAGMNNKPNLSKNGIYYKQQEWQGYVKSHGRRTTGYSNAIDDSPAAKDVLLYPQAQQDYMETWAQTSR